MNAPHRSENGPAIEPKPIKIVSFNVAGMKNVLEFKPWNTNKTLEYMFQYLKADIICLQETKIQMRDLSRQMAFVPGFKSYFTFPKVKKGYSGVAIYVSDKLPVIKAEEGITGWLSSDPNNSSAKPYRLCRDPIGGYPQSVDDKTGKQLDAEGRAVVLDLGVFVLIGLYCPANSQGDREDYKIAFMEALDQRVRNLIENQKREVIVVGDLNVSRELIDSAEGKQEWFKTGRIKAESDPGKFLEVNKEELESWKTLTMTRRIVNGWLGEIKGGHCRILTDTGRQHHPSRMAMYTCWNMKINARPGNFGSRLDYILISNGLDCQSADILPDLQGSDHCPVEAIISCEKGPPVLQPSKLPRLCTENMDQFRVFNIKSMFSAAALTGANSGANATAQLGNVDNHKRKSAGTTAPTASKKAKSAPLGQQTLGSFFLQKQPVPHVAANEELQNEEEDDPTPTPTQFAGNQQDAEQNEQIFRASTDWQSIFTPVKPPLCSGHCEPCVKRLTKKNGPNKGRSFWGCSRPSGSSDTDGATSKFRCNYFKWA